MYSADPSARVFGDSVYVYPSHDILATRGKGRVGWFCMEDYHVFSSANLTDWKDDGVVVTQNNVPWVKPDATACGHRIAFNGTGNIISIFLRHQKIRSYGRGFAIGVAVADKPYRTCLCRSQHPSKACME